MTTKNTFQILGMMSGTSLDGLDLALCTFHREGAAWSFQLIRSGYEDYPPELRTQLEEAIDLKTSDLLSLDAQYGAWLGKQASAFLGTDADSLDAVASHGHTVHHRPELGFTFQLGAPQYVALSSGLPVIGDFRSGDIALGGQGAPLVPIGDRLLFSAYEFCLNLGGIANISFEAEGKRWAFDIGIANMLLNHLVKPLGLRYDSEGAIARGGQINKALLEALDALTFYQKPYPKSTGYEWFSGEILPLIAAYPDGPENQLRTATEHIARQVALQVRNIKRQGPGRILVTGGGALNSFLMELLQQHLHPDFEVVLPNRQLIEFKEAIVFGFLGALRLCGQPNVLASVTGARRDSCSGILCLP
ncbi:anhydro-N-acetylmuramic acid kinase [Robiginitalea sp.]|uniref:anhydro-N-acetylmuramic acid kinase n=1 Tax=Robiginitalea sp. TaxID=1902411 RepID=UPI003C729AC9